MGVFVSFVVVNYPTPSIWTYDLSSKLKRTLFVHINNKSRISALFILVWVAYSSYILRRIISIVGSSGTFVKRLVTSNEIRSWSSSICMFSISSRKVFVFLTLNSDLFSGAKRLARYFVVLYVAVPMFEMIGRKSFLTPSPSFSLCT